MFYREAGQFKTSYAADQAIFPILQDRNLVLAFVILAFAVGIVSLEGVARVVDGIPVLRSIVPRIDDYYANAVLLPFLCYALAAMGLNILTGYCGQISLGTGAFLGVGAYTAFKLTTSFPDLNLFIVFLLAGLVTAFVGILFGLPSLRIKGFYLAVATLAAQFFLVWLFYKWGWLRNYSDTGQITVPPRTMFGVLVTGPKADPAVKYLFALSVVVLLTLAAKNIVRGNLGRSWMAIRDMDIAAELIGIRPLQTKLLAFGVSSFYVGVAGAMIFMILLGAAEAGETFGIQRSFDILFMVIIGGLGTILGAFLGAGFLVVMPIALKNVLVDWFQMTAVFAKHVEIMFMGTLIIFFLIVEPHGLARLWQIVKEKLRLWPFPH
ncbi:MAG: branched-chain amino acid ABC transporter permease [Hyphomicrobiaceae bacterium]|nr:branched-chain amino acid ABC transporter permease [Hyphomicrobiaceae bacterium]